MRTFVLPVIPLLLLSLTASAETEFQLAPSLLLFDYTEFSTSGSVLDNENGWLPGIQLQINKSLNPLSSAGFQFSIYNGDVDYDGQTQSGIPSTTTTSAMIFSAGAQLETLLTPSLSLAFGAKYNEWERDIHDNNGVSGLLEIYRWWVVSVGASVEFWKQEMQSWTVGATLLHTFRPEIHIDLSRLDYGSTDLGLGTDWGSRWQLAWQQRHAADSRLSVALFYESYDFGRSNTRATTGGGAGSLLVLEPRSETRNLGLLLAFTKQY